jgi:hypothetical protein
MGRLDANKLVRNVAHGMGDQKVDWKFIPKSK